ncbi:MAG: serine/threonine-protein phosphatase [Bifidobacteriaceae bacterium]|jgi:serine/threonine protein phosphatase PrpC|nr:serine/threonine-protein phosphatase [Bifidobacteriaceae bacterium]MCI1978876.1 serine/threonine-protein phosphatase [Bifidobacteriaceae bacterium]
MTQVSITSAALSDVGRRRRENQDNYLAADGLFLVADGMGGGVSGQDASATTLSIMEDLSTVSTRTRDLIDAHFLQSQDALRSLGEQQGAVAGTTLTGLILKDTTTLDSSKNSWYVINVGDSRTYHLSAATPTTAVTPPIEGVTTAEGTAPAQNAAPTQNNQDTASAGWNRSSFMQITHDHSERQEVIDSGKMLPHIAEQVVPRNIITQAIGSPNGIAPDYFQADLAGRFIICSDGVHSELTDSAIADIAARTETAETTAQHLLDAALAAGGRDNITVIVVDVIPQDPTPLTDSADETDWSVSTIGPGEDIDTMNDSTLETLRTTQTHSQE